MTTSKDPIKLRRRKTSTGLTSLYLDIYLKGVRTYEYLRLYLVPEKSREDKRKNLETLKLAETVRAKRIVELRNGFYGFKNVTGGNTLFFDYYEKMRLKHVKNSTVKNDNWSSALYHLRNYEQRKNITFAGITTVWIQGFRDFLVEKARTRANRPLAANSASHYLSILRTCVNQALKECVITEDPFRGVTAIKREETERAYLTVDEVRRLTVTPCEHDRIKRAFLFSCLTGLRWSDIVKMTWGEVEEQSGFRRIVFRQKKTGGQEYLDINSQAATLMGVRGKPSDSVFRNLHAPATANEVIKRWVLRAGIQKNITFHCARHTFAVMMLDLGVDIYTVSKLLGHRLVRTTQIYAKVLDKNKQAAVARIPQILENTDDEEKSAEPL
ncbi:MAG: site-specific integrase [Clostridia bacterium]|nr:site-specific integrase [Clostridia bacterium]